MKDNTAMLNLDIPSFPLNGRQLIEASAGTGKTYTIAALYVRAVLEQGLMPEQILVVTFTVAATDELKGRIRLFLKNALSAIETGVFDDLGFLQEVWQQRDRSIEDSDYKKRLEHALILFDQAAIHTIHGFAKKILEQFSFETGQLFGTEFGDDDTEIIRIVAQDCWRKMVVIQPPEILAATTAIWSDPAALARWLTLKLYYDKDMWYPPFIRDWSEKELEQIIAEYNSDLIKIITKIKTEAQNTDHLGLLLDWYEKGYFKKNLYRNSGQAIAKTDFSEDDIRTNINELYDFINRFTNADSSVEIDFTFADCEILQSRMKKNFEKNENLDNFPLFKTFSELHKRINDLKLYIAVAIQVKILGFCRERIQWQKQQSNLLSFDDLLSELQNALQNGKNSNHLKQLIRNKYPVAMIDEFQDTDPQQYSIFSGIYQKQSQTTALILIGDPKQSIYRFRGADIFAYLNAANEADNRFTLKINRRSSPDMVEAINTFFSFPNPFVYQDISYIENGSVADNAASIKLNGNINREAITINYAIKPDNEGIPAKDRAYNGFINDIVDLITDGKNGKADINGKPVVAGDIAILVSNRFQAEDIRATLAASGISCAYVGNDSVFDTEEAIMLELMLLAINNIENPDLLKSLLCSYLFPYELPDLKEIVTNDIAWNNILMQFVNYRDIWHHKGFIAMFHKLIHEQGIACRLLNMSSGERRLTNFLQLAELLQKAASALEGTNELIKWMQNTRNKGHTGKDEIQLRLESEENLVKIVTIHKSKGLEYPFVFIPYLQEIKIFEGKELRGDLTTPVINYNKEHGGRVLDFPLQNRKQKDAIANRAYEEALAECMRLLYVAVTRAKYCCNIYLAWNSGRDINIKDSVMLWLAREYGKAIDFINPPKIDDEVILSWINIFEQSNVISCKEIGFYEEQRSLQMQDQKKKTAIKTFSGKIKRDFRLSSYSSISGTVLHKAALHKAALDITAVDYDQNTITNTANSDIETPIIAHPINNEIPAGITTGNLFHKILEKISFSDTEEKITTEVEKQITAYGFDKQWQQQINAIILSTIEKKLDNSIQLNQLQDNRLLKELEFHLPFAKTNEQEFNGLFNCHEKYNRSGREFGFGTIRGYLKGYIDLLFCHNDIWYLIDYKSNRLENYNNDFMQKSITEHDYDLQYLLYTVAANRYLKNRIPGYNYKDNFGGIYYLFLRGINKHNNNGIWFDKPDKEFISSLDGFFNAYQ